MKNILNNYKAFVSGREKTKETLQSELKKAKTIYSGAFLELKEKELKENYQYKLKRLEDEHLKPLETEFETTRSKIKGVLIKPIPDDVLNVLNSLEGMKLTDTEKAEVLKITEGNYLARRKAFDVIGQDYTTSSPDGIIERMNELETAIKNVARSEEYSFMTAVLENGDWVNQVEKESTDFIGSFQ